MILLKMVVIIGKYLLFNLKWKKDTKLYNGYVYKIYVHVYIYIYIKQRKFGDDFFFPYRFFPNSLTMSTESGKTLFF